MYVYPKPGVLTRDPVKKDLLPETGREVADGDSYWLRRIADGSVTVGKKVKAKPQKPSGSEDA